MNVVLLLLLLFSLGFHYRARSSCCVNRRCSVAVMDAVLMIC